MASILTLRRQPTPEDGREQLDPCLNQAFRPAELLTLERVHFNRQFGGANHVGEVDELPALKLGPVAQIGILGQGVVLPPARVLDGPAPPDPGRAVEIEEEPRTVPATVLHHEVTVQNHGFGPGEKAVFGVDVSPSGLDHPYLGFGEIMDGLAQEGGLEHEIGVKDSNEFALGHFQTGFQGPGLVALAVLSMEVVDVEAGLAKAFHALPSQKSGFVVGIVQNLDLQQIQGIVQLGNRFDQPLHHKKLVVDGELDSYHRELGESLLELRFFYPCF